MSQTTKMFWALCRRLFTFLLGAVSFSRIIIGLETTVEWWQVLIIVVVVGILVFIAFADYREIRAEQPKLCVKESDTFKINDYMFNLLRDSGHVAIFSNDLTWVEQSEGIQNLLKKKARQNEVTLFLPREIAIAKALKDCGARTITYPDLNFVPRTRFTVLFHGTADARVAIGRRTNGYHVIREYHKDELPYWLSQDIVEILGRYSNVQPDDIGI